LSSPQDIRKLDLPAIKTALEEWGEKPFRAKQIYEWLWKKGARAFGDMTNLSKALREKLNEHFVILPVEIHARQMSMDGTVKCAFKLHDGHLVEGVLIPAGDRMTACISSQVGCSLSCTFCATGFLKRERNLEASEIYDQVLLINQMAEETYERHLSNIVFMGMGEPLLNYKNVVEGINHITGEHGLGMSPQRITVSTAGIAKMIKKLAEDQPRVNLALSLHNAINEKRSEIMPINDTNNLDDLAEALEYWVDETGIRPTLEYCVINDVNDEPTEAEALVHFARKFPSKINLIEYNPIDLAPYEASPVEKLERFKSYLESKRLIVNVRRSRGKDIDAACGQLANKLDEVG
jgi:23S rRNA (adenine2503-C2)-methyltransferase